MKSATTYLQALIQLNRRSLRDAGVWWPGVDENFAAIRDLFGDAGSEPDDAGAWRSLTREMQAFDGDVLLSNELLAKRDERQAKRLISALAPAEVHLVLTARDLGRVIPSMWQTNTRNRGTATWAEYLGAVYDDDRTGSDLASRFWSGQDLPDIVARWSPVVPKERLTLVTVPPPGSDPTVVGDRFMSVVAPRVTTLRQPPYRNPSLGAHSAELMRRVNLETTDWDMTRYRPALKNRLGRFILGGRVDREPRLGLTADQLAQATILAKDMVHELEGLDVRVVGALSDLIPAETLEPSDIDPDSSTDAEVLAAATYALVQLCREYADLKLQHDRLQSRRGGSAETAVPSGVSKQRFRPARSFVRKVGHRLRRLRR